MAHALFLSIAIIPPMWDRCVGVKVHIKPVIEMVPISGCRWGFTVWTLLGEKCHLIEQASVTIYCESSPLPCCSEKPKECLGFKGSLCWASHPARQTGHMSPSTVTTAVRWLGHTLATMGLRLGPRTGVTAQWGRSAAHQHCRFPASSAPHPLLLPHQHSDPTSCPALTPPALHLTNP